MSAEKTLDPAIVATVSQNILSILPLLSKRLLRIDAIQSIHGLPFSQVQALNVIKETGKMPISEISIRLGITKSNTTPLMDRLIASRYVSRVKDQSDKRMVNISILDAGREKLQAIQQTICEQIVEWAKDIPESDFLELSDSLQSISRILSRHP